MYRRLRRMGKAPERSAEKRDDRLVDVLRLGESSHARLLENLELGELRGLNSEVCIADLALCSRQRLGVHDRVVDGGVEAVLHRAEAGAERVDRGECGVE